jgi:hypothetical protein
MGCWSADCITGTNAGRPDRDCSPQLEGQWVARMLWHDGGAWVGDDLSGR